MTDWQPIETAPRDGSRILIYSPQSRHQVQEVWWAIPYEGSPTGYWSTPPGPQGRGYIILPEAPTHWMPLPAPPVAQPANTDSVHGSPLGSGARPSEQDDSVSSIGRGAEGEQ